MAKELFCLDTSILIDYFRKTKKENSFFYKLAQDNSLFTVSVITEFEIYSGSNERQQELWDTIFHFITVIPFDSRVNEEAIKIFKDLKSKNKLIEMPDLFIGATARAHKLKLATLNHKHFSRIEGLELITKPKE